MVQCEKASLHPHRIKDVLSVFLPKTYMLSGMVL